MYEAIVTLVFPPTYRTELGSGALLSRDRIVEDQPAHTEVYRIEFDTAENMSDWLNFHNHSGVLAAQEMGGVGRVEYK